MLTRNKSFSIRYLTGLAAAMIITACWLQEDTVTIGSDGTVEFSSSVIIEDKAKDFALSDIDELSGLFMKDLQDAGWEIERTWVSKTRPYKMTFSGSGNLKDVGQASHFYDLERVSDTEFKIRFIPAEREGRRSSRRIVFRKRLFASDASVYDALGKQVTSIDNVDERETYTIKLN